MLLQIGGRVFEEVCGTPRRCERSQVAICIIPKGYFPEIGECLADDASRRIAVKINRSSESIGKGIQVAIGIVAERGRAGLVGAFAFIESDESSLGVVRKTYWVQSGDLGIDRPAFFVDLNGGDAACCARKRLGFRGRVVKARARAPIGRRRLKHPA